MVKTRPNFTDEEKDEIIAHVLVNVAAGRAVTTVFAEDALACDERSFWRWYFGDDELRQKLAQARDNGVEARMELAVHVASTPMLGQIVTEKPVLVDGKPLKGVMTREVKMEDMLGHRRLLVDTLIKSAQMLKPKTYGPKLDVTSDGKALSIADEVEEIRLREAKMLGKK